MNTIFSIKKISGIMEKFKMNPVVDSFLVLELSLSMSYPEGKTAYFKKRIFELKEQVSRESYIGYSWVCNGSVYAVDANWLQKYMAQFYKKETEKIAWEALELFLRKYFQLLDYEKICKESEPNPKVPEPIIKREYLTFIHLRFKEWIKEPPDIWVERFIKDGTPVDPINTESEAKEGTGRLVILAILEAIHLVRGNDFDYQKFVKERFGINFFYKAIGKHKVKKGYIVTLKDCNDILKKMTPFES